MDRVNKVIRSISGHDAKKGYRTLRQAVRIALARLPERPDMKEIAREIAPFTEPPIKERSVVQALERTAADIWCYGCRKNLERIFGRPLVEQPTAKSLILTVAEYIQDLGEEWTIML